MASTVVMKPPVSHDEDEELSDEQIQQLLAEASARLTTSAENDQIVVTRTQTSGRLIPRLQTTISHAPYIREINGVATADPKLLISEEQRRLADSLRTVDTDSTSKKMVSRPCYSYLPASHEENISQYFP